MALAVPLSRFTPRVGGGSAFFVRPQAFLLVLASFAAKGFGGLICDEQVTGSSFGVGSRLAVRIDRAEHFVSILILLV